MITSFLSTRIVLASTLSLLSFSDVGPNCNRHRYHDANTVTLGDGGVRATSCELDPIDPAAVEVVDGRPFYAFYDGCNWCDAHGCTERACGESTDAGFVEQPIPFTPQDCRLLYFQLQGVALPEGETWVCDGQGRVFRSVCAPEGVTPSDP